MSVSVPCVHETVPVVNKVIFAASAEPSSNEKKIVFSDGVLSAISMRKNTYNSVWSPMDI